MNPTEFFNLPLNISRSSTVMYFVFDLIAEYCPRFCDGDGCYCFVSVRCLTLYVQVLSPQHHDKVGKFMLRKWSRFESGYRASKMHQIQNKPNSDIIFSYVFV